MTLQLKNNIQNKHVLKLKFSKTLYQECPLEISHVSQFALLINYCFLLARYHIWLAKSNENYPNLIHFVRLLKSQYEIETKKGDTRKWKPLAGYIPVNVWLISFLQLYLSLFNCPQLLTGPYLNSSRVFHMPLFLILLQQYK